MFLIETYVIRYGAGQGELFVEMYADEDGNIIRAISDVALGTTTWTDSNNSF